MVETTAKEDWLNWWLPFYAMAAALVAFVSLIIWSADGNIAYLLVALIVSLGLALFAIRYRGASAAVNFGNASCLFGCFVGLVQAFFCYTQCLSVASLVESVQGQGFGTIDLLEWRVEACGMGWLGFPGAGDTVVYLVFDPNNLLAAAARSQSPGKFGGIPCEVPSIRRMEGNWYTVRFYTETDWNHC